MRGTPRRNHQQRVYDTTSVPTVDRYIHSNARVSAIVGPFGSGKSVGSIMRILRHAREQEPDGNRVRRTRWAVVRNTQRQLRDTTIRTAHEWLPPTAQGIKWSESKLEMNLRLPGASKTQTEVELLFRALDRPDQVENLLSIEYTGAWVNEGREVPFSLIRTLLGRTGRYPPVNVTGGPTWHGLFLDSNPPDEDSDFYATFYENLPDEYEFFRQPSGRSAQAENLPNLVPTYYQDLVTDNQNDPGFIRVYVDALPGSAIDGKPVLPEWQQSFHQKDREPDPNIPIRRGWDFGLTPACTFRQTLPNGQVNVFAEVTSERAGIAQLCDRVAQFKATYFPQLAIAGDWPDPTGEYGRDTDAQSCFDIMRAKGLDPRPGEIDPTIRQEAVRHMLTTVIDGQPGLIVHSRCKKLIAGFNGKYRFRRLRVAADRYADKPEKNEYSHPHDALQHDMGQELRDLVLGRDDLQKTRSKRPRQEYANSEPAYDLYSHQPEFYTGSSQRQQYANSGDDPQWGS